MTLYLDASVLIPLFIAEARTDEAQTALFGQVLIVSDLAIVETSSGVARRARMGDISQSEAATVVVSLDIWVTSSAQREILAPGDVRTALSLVWRTDLGLRAPDAMNIAIALRRSAALFTFDFKMAEAARTLGLEVIGMEARSA